MLTVFTLNDSQLYTKNEKVENLIFLIANDNKDAVGDLYDLIKTDVYAFALSKLKNSVDAEDVMHDTFINVYKYAKQYSAKGKPMAWIITIELNLIRRQIQLKSRTTDFTEIHENTLHKGNIENERINSVFLRQLLQTLNEDEREIISLHVVSGFKHREIAKILNRPLSTVLSKYNRAINKLKIIVKEERDE